jgi:acyl-[acyl-carrier-protein]-phospholipid O-acyltransferase/long-chain-fatty-acid--[acyl-carrier-protein] ligase
VGVFAAAGVYFALAEGLRLGADKIFFAGACMTLAATFYAVVFLPDSVLRLALWILTHSVYRIHVEGRDNIPERGGALFVVESLTLLEAIFLSAATDRPIRFVADAKPFARTAPLTRRALRITQLPENRNADGFVRDVSAAFASGEVVCLMEETAKVLLGDSVERERLEDYLRETRTPIVVVSVKGARSGPLQSEEGRLSLAGSRLRGDVTLGFRAALAPAENPAFAEVLGWLKAAPALRFSPSD